MNTNEVDDFIKAKVLVQYHGIVSFLRQFIKKEVPNIQEQISYGIPVYRLKNIIAVISPTKKDITLSFSKGAKFEDKYKLLGGVGKVSKYVKINNMAEINESALKYYLTQAVKLDSK